MIQTYTQPNQDLNNFLNAYNAPLAIQTTKTVEPTYNNPFSADSIINKTNFLGPNANSTPMGLPQFSIPGTVASIQTGGTQSGGQVITPTKRVVTGGQEDTFNYDTGYSGPKKFGTKIGNTNPITGPAIPVPGYTAVAEDPRVVEARLIQEQTNQVVDPETLYQQRLTRQQSEIDAQNNIYNDLINQSRINNAAKYKGRIESRQFAQGRAGQIGSGTGEAGINAVQDANTQEQNAVEAVFNAQRVQAIAGIKGEIRKSSEAEAIANREARMKGADAIISNAALRATTRATTAKKAVKGLLAAGVDVSKMTDEEKKSYLEGIGISASDWNAISGEEVASVNKAKEESAKAELDNQKTKAEISNLEKKYDFEGAQKALDRQLDQKKIDVQWHQAESSRINALKKDAGDKPEPTKEMINKKISAAEADGAWDNWSSDERNRFIRNLGGLPSDYEI
jgi:hypothetical protein